MTVITNLCKSPHVTGIVNNKATPVAVDGVVAGESYVVYVGSVSADTRVSFGTTNKLWDGKPMQTKGTADTNLYIRAANDGDTVEVSGVTVCTLADWQRLQSLGLTFFDGDTMPIK